MDLISNQTLAEWMDAPVDGMKAAEAYENAYSFHASAAGLPFNTTADRDRWARDLIERSALAEVQNLEPPEPPVWPCEGLCPNDRTQIMFDHDNPEGWVHGDPNDAEC